MDSDIGKLRWRCRRGMKELDLLLTRYVDEQYGTAAPGHRQAFRRLLDCNDPLICDYLLGRLSPPDAVLSSLIERITSTRSNDG
ncbi:MAG: succinate dehydrogenase assembly factor 2 [Steroidobacteraceae bacterium]|jgi:antitoxin CptB